jgi:hypothetical protein
MLTLMFKSSRQTVRKLVAAAAPVCHLADEIKMVYGEEP